MTFSQIIAASFVVVWVEMLLHCILVVRPLTHRLSIFLFYLSTSHFSVHASPKIPLLNGLNVEQFLNLVLVVAYLVLRYYSSVRRSVPLIKIICIHSIVVCLLSCQIFELFTVRRLHYKKNLISLLWKFNSNISLVNPLHPNMIVLCLTLS